MRVLQTERKLFKLIGIISLCLIGGIATEALALDKAGVSAAVRGQVARANDEHPVGQQVASGEPIYLADRITSGPGAGMQIMLLDQTTFTIGPDSFVRIDEFVYDPNTNVGKVTATLGKGVFRFVTGKIAAANPSNMTVKLPNATIGIRGTMVIGSTNGERTVVGLVGPGPENNTHDKVAGIDVITANGMAEIRRPGWGAVIEGGRAPVVQPLPKALINGILNGVAPRDVAQAGSAGGTASSQTQLGALSGQSLANAAQIIGGLKPTLEPSPGASSVAAAAQNASQSVVTTFEQLRTFTSGGVILSQNGVPITGDGGSGSYNFTLIVNFGTQHADGAWGNINFTGTHINIAGGLVSFSGSYAGLTGFVSDTLNPAVTNQLPTTPNAQCAGVATCDVHLTVLNSGATIGAQAQHSVILTDTRTGITASGSGTAPRGGG